MSGENIKVLNQKWENVAHKSHHSKDETHDRELLEIAEIQSGDGGSNARHGNEQESHVVKGTE